MAQYPIKMLKDEEGQPFVPVVSASTIILMSGYDLQTELDKKLSPRNLIAGNNITIDKVEETSDCTINGPDIMNNLTTDAANKGVLDAYQGKVLNDKITSLNNTVTANKDSADKDIKALQDRAAALENGKVDKKEGYALSKNDFTDALKNKLDGIEAGAQVNTITGVKGSAEESYRTGQVSISKANIGLSEVENKSSATIRSEITSTNVTTALGFTPMNSTARGANNGVASLDADGKIPASQLPGVADDVLEFSTQNDFPETGESGKIYIAVDTNITYRWGGSVYVPIASDLALGETPSTAYPGDKGAKAYAHAVTNKGQAFKSGFYKIETNDEGHVTGTVPIQKQDIVDLGIPASDTTYKDATQTASGLMSSTDKKKLDTLATVASTGSYNDLIDQPSIPTKLSELANDGGYLTSESDPTVPAWVKSITEEDIASWAGKSTFDGDYNKLTNKPNIPTQVSDLANDAGYITAASNITGNAATAIKASQDGEGNVITDTYLKKAGDTVTGKLSFDVAKAQIAFGTLSIAGNGTQLYVRDESYEHIIHISDGSLRPGSAYHDMLNLGSEEARWKTVYGKDIYGTLHGNADSATKTTGSLTIKQNGMTSAIFNGSANTEVDIAVATVHVGTEAPTNDVGSDGDIFIVKID